MHPRAVSGEGTIVTPQTSSVILRIDIMGHICICVEIPFHIEGAAMKNFPLWRP